jgi:hypothetical protein
VFSKSKIFKFLKRDCGTIPVAEIINGKIEIFSKHQRFVIIVNSKWSNFNEFKNYVTSAVEYDEIWS